MKLSRYSAARLTRASKSWRAVSRGTLENLLFPTESEYDDARGAWRDHSVAMPFGILIQYALTRLWEEWGITPDRLLGHGTGEYAAALSAGCFSLEDLLPVLVEQARLLRELPVARIFAVPLFTQ